MACSGFPRAITEVTGDNRAPAWAINTLALASLDGGLTPYNTLDNPLPAGYSRCRREVAAGLNTLIGQNAAANQRNFHTGYMQQWNFDIQQELGTGTVLEVLYAGSAGVGLAGAVGEPDEPASGRSTSALGPGSAATGSQSVLRDCSDRTALPAHRAARPTAAAVSAVSNAVRGG